MSEFHMRDVQDVEYVVGRPFSDEDGEHEPGEIYTAEQANQLHYLEAFVNAGFLYRVIDKNYDHLPPHVFNHVKTTEEAEALVEGDNSYLVAQGEWDKPAASVQAEREAEVQTELHANVLQYAADAHEAHGYSASEQVLQKEQEEVAKEREAAEKKQAEGKVVSGPPARKTAAKKTAAKKA